MAEDQEQVEGVGPGERLRRAREAMGRSREDMAEALRLTVEQVEALEAEDYSRLPGQAYVRGYFRNYAAAVGLAPEEVAAQVEQRPAGGGPAEENDTPLIPEPEKPLIEHPWRVVWISLALLVVVSVVTVWLVGESRGPAMPEQTASRSGQAGAQTAAGGGPAAAGESARPAGGEADGGAPSGEVASAGGDAASAGGEPAGGGASATAPTRSATAAAGSGSAEGAARPQGPTLSGPGLDDSALARLPGSEQPRQPAMPEDLQTLRVHTWAKSWLEVADDRGQVLLRRLIPEGRDLRLYGKPPFQVKAGNAAAVQLYFEDKPIRPLGAPGQVVRLNVDADTRTIPESEVAPPASLAEQQTSGQAGSAPAPSGDGESSAAATGQAEEPGSGGAAAAADGAGTP
ncbi:MAG TPA: helix-turn-helix domain-containing protein [Gammaproteobacteria bacterium]|nr:helix-turn-helix domain-containing protein [Gammaproteobacteria bacterium]